MKSRWYRRDVWTLLASLLLVSCSIESASNTTDGGSGSAASAPATNARPTPRSSAAPRSTAVSNSPSTAATATAGGRYFLIDTLVRSTQIDGIDLHLRYAEQTADGLLVHLSFYNNRGEDLAYVSGASASDAQLVGDQSYSVSETSESLATGIDPDGGWLNGGATVGTLTFAGASGTTFGFEFPGFPDVTINLDQPLDELPEPLQPSLGSYDYDLEVTSDRLENIGLRVERAEIQDDALLLTIAFVNQNSADITFSSTVNGNDAVLFDSLWRQYRPGQVEQTLDRGIGPEGSVWGEGEANRGTLTFPRPLNAEALLFQFPTYPLLWLPLEAGATARVATDADLPPSSEPRPTPTAQPTPTPLSGEDLARQQVSDLFVTLTTALTERDRDAYLSVFAPDLQADQADIFERIATLPLDEVTFAPVDNPRNGSFNSDSSAVSGYAVDVSYRVQDVDPDNLFSSTPEYSVERTASGWQISEVGGQLPFWAYGPTEATRSGAFWIFYRPQLAEELPAIEQEAQQAFEQVTAALPNRARPVNVMHVTATEEEFAALTERSGSQFLGVATARYQIRKAGIQITSQAFFINGAAFQADPSQDRQRTIAHELTHLVLSPSTMPFTPAWLSEGAAMYISDDVPETIIADWLADDGAAKLSLADLNSKTSFGEHDFTGTQTSIDYAYSAYLTRYIVETYGEDTFFALYDSLAEVPYEVISDELPAFAGGSLYSSAFGTLADKLTSEQIETTLGIDLATLERDYEAWLASEITP